MQKATHHPPPPVLYHSSPHHHRLLVLLKTVSTQYDSPTIAYGCGPTAPFATIGDPAELPYVFDCLVTPAGECSEVHHYYKDKVKHLKIFGYEVPTFSLQLGYTSSAATQYYPFYSGTVGATNAAMAQWVSSYSDYNPSQSFGDMVGGRA